LITWISRALTQGALIEQWLMKNDFQPVVGHRFTFRTEPMPHWNDVTDCEVLTVEPPRRLAYGWNSSGEEAANGLKTVVTWTLAPANVRHARAPRAGGLPARPGNSLPGRRLRLAAVRGGPGPGGRRAGLTPPHRLRQ
jgi:hypothetical protein